MGLVDLFNTYRQRVQDRILSKTQDASISEVDVGGSFDDLADLLSGTITQNAESRLYDQVNNVYRDYINTAEVDSSFSASDGSRVSGRIFYVNTGGTLTNGVITGGTRAEWWYVDSVLTLRSSDTTFNGNRAITRNVTGLNGVTPGGTKITDFLNNVFYPAVAPIVQLSVNNPQREAGASTAYVLSWNVIKQTNPIMHITVDGTVITPTGNSQNGTQAGSFANNNPGTFTKVMSADDGTLVSNASASATFQLRIYYGTNASSSPDRTDVLALAGSALTNSRALNLPGFGGDGKYHWFAIPTAFGTPTFKVNGLTSTAYTANALTTFTNFNGYTVPLTVYVSNTPQNSPADIIIS